MKKTQINDLDSWLYCLDQQESESDFARCFPRFIKPFHLVLWASYARKNQLDCLHIENDDAKRFAIRMGLWDAAGLEAPHDVKKNSSEGRFMEAKAIKSEDDVHETSEYLEKIIANQNKLDDESRDSIGIVLSELLGNCYHHASPEIDLFGLVGAQVWSRGELAQIAIVDAGLGIRRTLSNNSDLRNLLANENACKLATDYEVTGKPYGRHSGYGLTLSKDILLKNNGNLIVLSGNEAFQCCERKTESFELSNTWDGTLIIFEWNINQPLGVEAVYNDWSEIDKQKENYDETLEDLF